MSALDMFNAASIKHFMLDVFSQIVYQKFDIDLSGLRSPTELFNFLRILQELYRQYQKHGIGQPSDSERLKTELAHFCREYGHVLPAQWTEAVKQLNNSKGDSMQYLAVHVLAWWNGLGQGLLLVKAVMYASQWNELCRTKQHIEQLIQAGYHFVHIRNLNEKLALLQQRANRVEEMVSQFRFTHGEQPTLLQQIGHELREANQNEYKQIMQIISFVQTDLATESKNLCNKRQTVSTVEKVSWLGAIAGAGLVAYSYMSQTKEKPNSKRVSTQLGWTVAAASVASLGYTTSEKSKLEKLEDLLKDRLDRLTAIDGQLNDIRLRLDQYQCWMNVATGDHIA